MLSALGTALAAKFLLESNAEPETEEIDLVAIFEGKELGSTAQPFYGGKVTAMFGGVMLDLREAQPSPTGIDLDLVVLMGGAAVVVPAGWRVKTDGRLNIVVGGFDHGDSVSDDEDAPTVLIRGTIVMGGLQVVSKKSSGEEEE